MSDTCDRPIRDRSGEELPGVTCNLPAGHLGKHAQIWIRATATWVDAEGKPQQAAQAIGAPDEDPTSRR